MAISGKVVSVNADGSGPSGSGMGVRFNDLSEEQKKGVDELYEHSAYKLRK